MSKVEYKKRIGYYGLFPVPIEYMREVFTGGARVEIPDEVWIHNIYYNAPSCSFHLVLRSKEEVEGVTFETEEGTEIPRADIPVRIGNYKIVSGQTFYAPVEG